MLLILLLVYEPFLLLFDSEPYTFDKEKNKVLNYSLTNIILKIICRVV